MEKSQISFKQLEKFEEAFKADIRNSIALNAATNNGILESAKTREAETENQHSFSIEIETGKITNQKKSGRCWMFASLNVMRLEVMNKLNLENFELSQAYPLFFDKLEKTNYFLENIIESIDKKLESREIAYLLQDPLCDGGQWDMFCGIINKYGVVPKEMMGESISSSNTRNLNSILTCKLREFAATLREKYLKNSSIDSLREEKENMLNTIYRILCISLGTPPKKFTFETRDKDNNFVRIENITAKEFYKKYVNLNLDEYISIINAPTKDKPYNNTYTVKYLGSVKGERPVKYLNLPISSLKELAIKQLKDNNVVWFGSDVGQSYHREKGLMALNTYNLESLFNTKFSMNKAQRLDYGESLMTHAMVLTGVNLIENDCPNRWKVENSWGEDVGNKGYFVMSDKWFEEFTYQVVINKKYLSKEQLEMFKKEPIVLNPWDPMGSLAK